MAIRIQLRRDTAANWSSINPVLNNGEPGFDTTNKILKIGDGITAWNDLGAINGEGISSGVSDGDKGDVIVSSNGTVWNLDTSGVVAGSYAYATITVDDKGRITSASEGATALSTVATSGSYSDLSNLPTLGTAAALNVGTGSNNVVQLDGTGKLPAVDGSLLTNLPTGSVSAATSLIFDHTTTPADPGAGKTAIYAKSDGLIYKLAAGGSEENVGGASAFADLSDVDTTGLQTGQAMIWNGAVWVPGSTGREVLTADRTYYVRTDGNDSNDGLTDTAGGAFLTIQKAVDVVSNLDLSTYQATIQVQEGQTFTENIILPPTLGSTTPLINGNPSARPTLTCVTGSAIKVLSQANWKVSGCKITTPSGAQDCFTVFGKLTFPNDSSNEFAGWGRYGILCASGGIVELDENEGGVTCLISAGGIGTGNLSFLRAFNNGIISAARGTWTLTGTPSWGTSGAFVFATQGASVDFIASTFTGSATGKRYDVQQNAVVRVTGASTTFFPGDVAGTTATGGQYA